MTLVFLVYVAVSLLVGGAAASYEIWHRPLMLDRADGRGKFPSPKMRPLEVIIFGLFVALIWPLLTVFMILEESAARR